MTNLKPVNVGFNKYCGPAVLSILTGKNTDECVRAIRYVYPQYDGAEVPYNILLQAADKLGYDTPAAQQGTSLYGTIVRLAKQDGIYVILVPRHVVVVEIKNRLAYFCDNHTKEVIPASSSARLGQRVFAVNRFVERPKPVLLRVEPRVEIDLFSKIMSIKMVDIYDDPKHTTSVLKGSIIFNDVAELELMIEAINDVYKRTISVHSEQSNDGMVV